jgi:hypothetical protein
MKKNSQKIAAMGLAAALMAASPAQSGNMDGAPDWAGFYGGIIIGVEPGGWTAEANPTRAFGPSKGFSGEGFYGVRAGYRFNFGPVVFGLGVDITNTRGPNGGFDTLASQHAPGHGNDFVPTFGGHVGLPIGEAGLFYASLGVHKQQRVRFGGDLEAEGPGGSNVYTAGLGYEIFVGGGLSFFSEFVIRNSPGMDPRALPGAEGPGGKMGRWPMEKGSIRFGLNFSLP